MLLLVRIIARDERQGGFGGAKIDRLVRYVGLDINEISLVTDNRILQLLTVARIHPAFEQINGGFIALMQVRLGGASGSVGQDVGPRPVGETVSLVRGARG